MRTSRRSDLNESGSVTMWVGLTMTILLMMVVASMVIGRYSMYEREVQNAADAAALAAAYSLEQFGKPQGDLNEDPVHEIIRQNSRLVPTDTRITPLHRWYLPADQKENRALVQVDLEATFDTFQELLPNRTITFKVQSFAQINEVVYSETWPALTIVVDASDSMDWPLQGTTNAGSAWDTLRNVIRVYTQNTLPLRTGLVIYRGTVAGDVAPPQGNSGNNLAAINTTVTGVDVPAPNDPTNPLDDNDGKTNTYAGLEKAWEHQRSMLHGRNVLLISDGEPTAGPPICDYNDPLCFTRAEDMARKVRRTTNDGAGAALFTVEIARTNSGGQTEQFLKNIAGPPDSAGGDDKMYTKVQTLIQIVTFLRLFSYNICAFGPLSPGEGYALADMEPLNIQPYRMRPVIANLADPDHLRVMAFIQDSARNETRLARVDNQVTYSATGDPIAYNWSSQDGFELFVDDSVTPPASWVILTFSACNLLGSRPDNRLVVRWGEPELIGQAAGTPTL